MSTRTPESEFVRWRERGNPDALAFVFDALAPGLHRLAVHVAGDASVAEDLVQTTFQVAIEQARTYDTARPLSPWLGGILLQHARKLRTSGWRARRVVDEGLLERIDEATPLERAEANEDQEELLRAIDALDEPYRTVVLLRMKHGLNAAEIAHVVHASPGAVRVQLHRARELLRKSLPAGFAAALALLAPPARGLELVKTAVVEHATASHVAAIAGGAFVVKKIAGVAALVIALCALVWWMRGEPLERDAAVSRTSTNAPLAMSSDDVARSAAPLAPMSAAPDVRADAAPAALGVHRFAGRVLDAVSATPIAGAEVELFASRRAQLSDVARRHAARLQPDTIGRFLPRAWPQPAHELTQAELAGLEPIEFVEAPGEGEAPIARTTSGADGTFELRSGSGAGFLIVRAAGFGTRRLPWTGELRERDVALARAWKITGRIVDADLAPIARRTKLLAYAHVRVSERSQATSDEAPLDDDAWEIETDDGGRFTSDAAAEMAVLYSAEPAFEVTAHGTIATGKLASVPWIRSSNASGDLVVVLRENPVLEVRDARTRKPIERFRLDCKLKSGAVAHFSDWQGWFDTPDGRMSLSPPLRWYQGPRYEEARRARVCTVWAPGYRSATFERGDLVTPGLVEIALEPDDAPSFVEGRVTRGGTALSGAQVFAFRGGASYMEPRFDENTIWMPFAGAAAGADGRFRLELPPAIWALRVVAGEDEVTLPATSPSSGLEIEFEALASLEVVVRDVSGAPAKLHELVLRGADGGYRDRITDGEGRARFGFLPRGAQTLIVRPPPAHGALRELARRELELVTRESRTLEVEIPLASERYAKLVVDGVAAFVGWRAGDRFGSTDSLAAIEPNGRIPVDLRERQDFRILGPEGDTWHVQVPDDARDGHEIRLDVVGPGYEGTLVELGSGKPLAGVEIRVYERDPTGPGKPSRSCRTDAQGRFRVRGLPSTPHSMFFERGMLGGGEVEGMRASLARPPSTPPETVTLALPVRDADVFRGAEPARLRGRLRWGSTPVTGVQAYLTAMLDSPDARIDVTQTLVLGADGAFDTPLPRAPRYSAFFWNSKTGTKSGALSWDATGGEVELKDFELP